MFTRDLARRNARLDPWREMRRVRDQLDQVFRSGSFWPEQEYPAVNLWTNNDGAVLTAELPGVRAEDLDISVQGGTVTLRGSRQAEKLQEGQAYHRQERVAGSFVRAVDLPFAVDPDTVEASLDKGVLQLRVGRAERDKPKKIEIKNS